MCSKTCCFFSTRELHRAGHLIFQDLVISFFLTPVERLLFFQNISSTWSSFQQNKKLRSFCLCECELIPRGSMSVQHIWDFDLLLLGQWPQKCFSSAVPQQCPKDILSCCKAWILVVLPGFVNYEIFTRHKPLFYQIFKAYSEKQRKKKKWQRKTQSLKATISPRICGSPECIFLVSLQASTGD